MLTSNQINPLGSSQFLKKQKSLNENAINQNAAS